MLASSSHTMRLANRKRKRLRVNGACDTCRDRKTRCDGRHPVCLACENRGLSQSCHYKGRQCNSQRQNFESMSVNQSQPQVNAVYRDPSLQAGTPTNSDPACSKSSPAWLAPQIKESDGLATVATCNDSSSYGPSSTVAFFRRILSDDDILRDAVDKDGVDEHGQALTEPTRPTSDIMLLPRRVNSDKFVTCYWEFIHPMFPVLHKTTFMEQYEQFWATESGINDGMPFKTEKDYAVFVSTLNLVFALGCQFSEVVGDTRKASVAHDFYERSRESYNHDWLDSADLPHVQLLVLNGVYLQSTQHANRCWNSIGLAIRVAQILGLQVKCAIGLSQLEREMRKRIWHTCISLDRLLSMTFGRPTMVHEPNTIPVPENVDDEYLQIEGEGSQPPDEPSRLGLFVHSCSLLEILGDVLHFVTNCEPAADRATAANAKIPRDNLVGRVLEINGRLDDFSETLPAHLKINEPGSDPSYTDQIRRQRQILRCRFLLTRLLLLRPLLLSTISVVGSEQLFTVSSEAVLEDSIVRQCCQLCLSTSYRLIDSLWENLGTLYRNSGWHTVYFTFSSAVVLLASLKSHILTVNASDTEFQIHWTRCLSILDYYDGQVPSAAHAGKLLRTVQHRFLKSLERPSHFEGQSSSVGHVGATSWSEPDANNTLDSTGQTLFLNDDFEMSFGTNLTNLDWLELFQSHV